MYGVTDVQIKVSYSRVVGFKLWTLYSWGKSPEYTMDGNLGGPQSRSERYGAVKIPDTIATRISGGNQEEIKFW
jgi:hypothetical protein